MTGFTGLDMEIYHKAVDMLGRLMLFIFQGLDERYVKETELPCTVYAMEPFKLPEVGNVPQIGFAKALGCFTRLAAGERIGGHDDLTTPQGK